MKVVIRDRVILGTLASLVAAVPQAILNLISKALGLSKIYSFTLAGGVFLRNKITEDSGGIFLGSILWLFTAAFLGYLIVLFLQYTGKDYWWFKGPFVTIIFMHLLIYGFMFNMANAKVIPIDIPTNISIFAENIVFGVIVGYLIIRWSGDVPELKGK